ncbi:hypothetical protein ACB098_11G149700 [Castanea mollissima]
MDVLGVNQAKSKRQAKRSKKGIKVVYIASPMKVETSASKFRDLVQELTGQDSDTARYMEANGGDHHQDSFNFSDQQFGVDINRGISNKLPLSNSRGEFMPYPESIFKSFNEHLQFDVYGSLSPM